MNSVIRIDDAICYQDALSILQKNHGSEAGNPERFPSAQSTRGVLEKQWRILLLTLVSFWIVSLSTGQAFQIDKRAFPIDSLQKILPALSRQARVDCLNELGRSYAEALEFKAALPAIDQAYKEAANIHYAKGLGQACLLYGLIYYWRPYQPGDERNYLAESKNYYQQAARWFDEIQDHNGLGYAYRGLCILESIYDTSAALKALEQARWHFRKAGNKIMLADLLDHLGEICSVQGHDEKFFEFVKKALKEKKQLHNYRGLVWSYRQLGLLYQFAGDMETGLQYNKMSCRLADSLSLKWDVELCIGNVYLWTDRMDSAHYYLGKMLSLYPDNPRVLASYGQLCMNRGQYAKALKYLQPALNYFKNNHHWQAPWVLIDIAKCYFGLKQYTRALEYARECAESASVLYNVGVGVLTYVYELYSNIYEVHHQTDSALFYYRKYALLKDSIDGSQLQRQQFQRLSMYKVAVNEEQQQARIEMLHKDNQIKQQQLQKEALQKKLLVGSLLILALFGLIVVRNVFLKRKNERHKRELVENELQIQKLETEKAKAEFQQQATELEMQALRAQMNPHFIFNSLNSINQFILQNDKAQASEYLTKFSRLVRLILQNSQAALISLEREMEALQLYLELEALRFNDHFDFIISIHEDLDIGMLKVPPLIIQPFTENAIWHGLMHKKEKGHLAIELFQEDDVLYCKITDDGIGRKKAIELKNRSKGFHTSMGMRITTDRIALLQQKRMIQTSMQVNDLVLPDGSAGGTEVIIKLPVRYD